MIGVEKVRRRLTYARCIPLVREAMIAFSTGRTRQLLRSIIPLTDGQMFGVTPGALGGAEMFGAKVVSVFPGVLWSSPSSLQLRCANDAQRGAGGTGFGDIIRGGARTTLNMLNVSCPTVTHP